MVIREPQAGGQICYKTRLGEAVFSTPAPDVALVRYQGHAETTLYEPIATEMNALLKRGTKVQLFVDFEHLASYDTEFRTRWTEWFRRNRERLTGSYILQRSALVKMGIQLVNLFVGEILTPVTDRQEFEAKLEEAIRRSAARAEKRPDRAPGPAPKPGNPRT